MDLTLFVDGSTHGRGPRQARHGDTFALCEALASRGVDVALRLPPRSSARAPKGHVLVLSAKGSPSLSPLLGFLASADEERVWPTPSVLRTLLAPRGMHRVRRSLEGFSTGRMKGDAVAAAAARHGIVSLFAFGGIFSHGVRSPYDREANGPDRAASAPVFASTYELLYAHHALSLARARGIVARVDLCRDDTGAVTLFSIDVAPAAFAAASCDEGAARFADTIVRWIQRA
jgi:hypothetical protein